MEQKINVSKPLTTEDTLKQIEQHYIQKAESTRKAYVKGWCFTENGESFKKEGEYLKPDPRITYAIWQLEQGHDNGKLHLQGYVVFAKKQRLNTAKCILGSTTVHMEPRLGNHQQAIDYCSKEDTRIKGPWEFGDKKQSQGHRSDLDGLTQDIKSGKSLYDIVDTHTNLYIKYNRGIEKALSVLRAPRGTLEQVCRNIDVYVFYGNTGSGKTYAALNGQLFQDIYRLDLTGNSGSVWFDGYTGQKRLVIDEFTGQVRCSELLKILDKYPYQVAVKGGSTWAQWTEVIITSNFHPQDWYKTVQEEHVRAVERRITKGVWYYPSRNSKPIHDDRKWTIQTVPTFPLFNTWDPKQQTSPQQSPIIECNQK